MNSSTPLNYFLFIGVVLVFGLGLTVRHYEPQITYSLTTLRNQKDACINKNNIDVCLQLVHDYRDGVIKSSAGTKGRYRGAQSHNFYRVLKGDVEQAKLYAKHACSQGDPNGCFYSWMYSDAYEYTDHEKASELCNDGSLFACNFLLTHNNRDHIPVNTRVLILNHSCMLGHNIACVHKNHYELLELLADYDYLAIKLLLSDLLHPNSSYNNEPNVHAYIYERNKLLIETFYGNSAEDLTIDYTNLIAKLSTLELPSLYIPR